MTTPENLGAPLRKRGAFFFALDTRACGSLNRMATFDSVRWPFMAVSRLGDGIIWYLTLMALPLAYGIDGLQTSLAMAVTGLCGLGIYRFIKGRTTRLRPYRVVPGVRARMRPLDHYSFPSGHTLQAVGFTTVACAGHPELAVVLWPFTILVALSRPVLGLHYPSDVVVGAAIGWGVATTVSAVLL